MLVERDNTTASPPKYEQTATNNTWHTGHQKSPTKSLKTCKIKLFTCMPKNRGLRSIDPMALSAVSPP